jgi:hypothetical protein
MKRNINQVNSDGLFSFNRRMELEDSDRKRAPKWRILGNVHVDSRPGSLLIVTENRLKRPDAKGTSSLYTSEAFWCTLEVTTSVLCNFR